MQDTVTYAEAKLRVAELRDFYGHLITYAGVNAGLFIVDVVIDGGWWFFWPLLGWGVGVASHALKVSGRDWRPGKEWERRKVEEFLARPRHAELKSGDTRSESRRISLAPVIKRLAR